MREIQKNGTQNGINDAKTERRSDMPSSTVGPVNLFRTVGVDTLDQRKQHQMEQEAIEKVWKRFHARGQTS